MYPLRVWCIQYRLYRTVYEMWEIVCAMRWGQPQGDLQLGQADCFSTSTISGAFSWIQCQSSPPTRKLMLLQNSKKGIFSLMIFWVQLFIMWEQIIEFWQWEQHSALYNRFDFLNQFVCSLSWSVLWGVWYPPISDTTSTKRGPGGGVITGHTLRSTPPAPSALFLFSALRSSLIFSLGPMERPPSVFSQPVRDIITFQKHLINT